ncbi:MAG: hypothetical protein INF12_14815 [Methylobacterium sp.]|nr:hypothetical protein [Methylobacterium sp.]
MKICVLLICSLVPGSPTECNRGPGAYELVDLPHITTAAACKRVADDIRSGALPLPANLRLVRRDMMPPKEQPAQEAKR